MFRLKEVLQYRDSDTLSSGIEFNLIYRKRAILHPAGAIIKHNLVLTNGSFISSLTASASYRTIADILVEIARRKDGGEGEGKRTRR